VNVQFASSSGIFAGSTPQLGNNTRPDRVHAKHSLRPSMWASAPTVPANTARLQSGCCPTGVSPLRSDHTRRHRYRKSDSIVSLLVWIVLGLISGFIASKIINGTREGLVLDIVLGTVGGLLGGSLFSPFGMAGVNGLNPYSFMLAIVGAAAVLVTSHFLVRSARAIDTV
jgi:uncharacterized membrane protein YeaQ/YmgE (transglycosylase-associated protein family)